MVLVLSGDHKQLPFVNTNKRKNECVSGVRNQLLMNTDLECRTGTIPHRWWSYLDTSTPRLSNPRRRKIYPKEPKNYIKKKGLTRLGAVSPYLVLIPLTASSVTREDCPAKDTKAHDTLISELSVATLTQSVPKMHERLDSPGSIPNIQCQSSCAERYSLGRKNRVHNPMY